MDDIVCFTLLGFGAGLRGEEAPLVNLEGLLTFWMETREEEDKYKMITLQGRFKGEIDQHWHIVPICDVTRLGIPFRLWMEQIMYPQVRLQGRSNGWLFEQKPFYCPRQTTRPTAVTKFGGNHRLQSVAIALQRGGVEDHHPQCGCQEGH